MKMNMKHITVVVCIAMLLLVDAVFSTPSGRRLEGDNSEFNLENPAGKFWQTLVGSASGGRARRQIPHGHVEMCGRDPSLCGRPSRERSSSNGRRNRNRMNRNRNRSRSYKD